MTSTQHTAHSTQYVVRRVLSHCLLSAVCCLLTTGCIRRSLTIRTDPPGALIYVNDQLKGPSPLTYDFEWYGWHRVMIRKEGYQRLDDRKMLRAPIWMWIPCDLAMELLPFPVKDRRTWSYALVPQQEPPQPIPPELFNESPPAAPPTTEPPNEPR
ncbi:MAG: PEGA domain-containing protein [Candidatus Omnitrophica bacterium]|nr:PEGA domain-containing protein [Candidatus Omnitrophota bacterium]